MAGNILAIPKKQVRSRNKIEQHEHEDDADARRVTLVDYIGDFISPSNPLPVEITQGNITIGTVNNDLSVQLSHEDADPDIGDIADSVRIGDGVPGEFLKINPDGSIDVNANIGGASGNIVNIYNDIASVAAATLTTIVSYTIPVGKSAVLHRVEYGGENIGLFDVEVNGIRVGRRRTYFGGAFSDQFEFGLSNGVGVTLVAGDVVRLRVEHNRPMTADFEGRIEVLQD